jgi:hypothetical protein
MDRRMEPGIFWPIAVLACFSFSIAGYAFVSYLTGTPLEAGFFQGKVHYQHFVPSTQWTSALVIHVAGGCLALVAGGMQWLLTRRSWKVSRPAWFRTAHILLGLTYLTSIVVGAGAGLVLVPQAMGGSIAAWGFGLLDGLWIASTLIASALGWRLRKRPELRVAHHGWMIRSFALTSAAITLRLWLPLGVLVGFDFLSAYAVIAWLCWVPNLLVAEFLARKVR